MVFFIDIDNTLLFSEAKKCKCGGVVYRLKHRNAEEIQRINQLYSRGETIILWTGRGWDAYKVTVKQLKQSGIKFHQLIMGKPWGVYVDRDSEKTLKDYV